MAPLTGMVDYIDVPARTMVWFYRKQDQFAAEFGQGDADRLHLAILARRALFLGARQIPVHFCEDGNPETRLKRSIQPIFAIV